MTSDSELWATPEGRASWRAVDAFTVQEDSAQPPGRGGRWPAAAPAAPQGGRTRLFACQFVVKVAVRIPGGMGYVRKPEAEGHYFGSRIFGIGGGTNEITDEFISKTLLGVPSSETAR